MLTKAERDEMRARADAAPPWGRFDIAALLDALDTQDAEVARLTAENDRLIVIARADEWQARYWAEHDAVADRETTIMAERAQAAAYRKALDIGSKCVTIHQGDPPGTTCLDNKRRASDLTLNWSPEYRTKQAAGVYLCERCQRREVLESTDAGKALLDAHAAQLEKLEHLLTERSRQALARILELEAHAAELAKWEEFRDVSIADGADLRQRLEAAELFRAAFERPRRLCSGQCCDPVIDGEICALLRRVEVAEHDRNILARAIDPSSETPAAERSTESLVAWADGVRQQVKAVEATLEAVKVEISGDANFGRIVEMLFYGPLREKKAELRLTYGEVEKLEAEIAALRASQVADLNRIEESYNRLIRELEEGKRKAEFALGLIAQRLNITPESDIALLLDVRLKRYERDSNVSSAAELRREVFDLRAELRAMADRLAERALRGEGK